MQKPYKNGILLAATSNCAFTLGAMIANIADVMSGVVDIFYIVHDGFSVSEMNALSKLQVVQVLNLLALLKRILLLKSKPTAKVRIS